MPEYVITLFNTDQEPMGEDHLITAPTKAEAMIAFENENEGLLDQAYDFIAVEVPSPESSDR